LDPHVRFRLALDYAFKGDMGMWGIWRCFTERDLLTGRVWMQVYVSKFSAILQVEIELPFPQSPRGLNAVMRADQTQKRKKKMGNHSCE